MLHHHHASLGPALGKAPSDLIACMQNSPHTYRPMFKLHESRSPPRGVHMNIRLVPETLFLYITYLQTVVLFTYLLQFFSF